MYEVKITLYGDTPTMRRYLSLVGTIRGPEWHAHIECVHCTTAIRALTLLMDNTHINYKFWFAEDYYMAGIDSNTSNKYTYVGHQQMIPLHNTVTEALEIIRTLYRQKQKSKNKKDQKLNVQPNRLEVPLTAIEIEGIPVKAVVIGEAGQGSYIKAVLKAIGDLIEIAHTQKYKTLRQIHNVKKIELKDTTLIHDLNRLKTII